MERSPYRERTLFVTEYDKILQIKKDYVDIITWIINIPHSIEFDYNKNTALADRNTIFIEKRLYDYLSQPSLEFVVLHELAHIYYHHFGTVYENELEADIWASKMQLKKRNAHYGEKALKEIVKMFNCSLDSNSHTGMVDKSGRIKNLIFQDRINNIKNNVP